MIPDDVAALYPTPFSDELADELADESAESTFTQGSAGYRLSLIPNRGVWPNAGSPDLREG
jgi:hypothetical protein